MVGIALLMALVVIMQAISGLIPPVSGFSISLVLIPIVIEAAVYGPGAGALLGATFGIIVYHGSLRLPVSFPLQKAPILQEQDQRLLCDGEYHRRGYSLFH